VGGLPRLASVVQWLAGTEPPPPLGLDDLSSAASRELLDSRVHVQGAPLASNTRSLRPIAQPSGPALARAKAQASVMTSTT
jgi:hypothetical protein